MEEEDSGVGMEIFASDLAKAVSQPPPQPQPQQEQQQQAGPSSSSSSSSSSPPPYRRVQSLDVAGEQRMTHALSQMIDEDEAQEEAFDKLHGGADRWREQEAEGGLFFTPPQSQAATTAGGTPALPEGEVGEGHGGGYGPGHDGGDGDGDGGEQEELQGLIVRLMLHSAGSGGAPLEPALEGDLRTLVGSSLFDEIFAEREAGGHPGRQHSQLPPAALRGPPAFQQHHMRRGGSNTDVLFALAALRRRSGGGGGEGDGDDDEGEEDEDFGYGIEEEEDGEGGLLAAGLEALRMLPPSDEEAAEAGAALDFMGETARRREARAARQRAAELEGEDDIRLQPPPPRPASVEVVEEEGAAAVVEDEWEDDADPGYVAMHISEAEFFDMVRVFVCVWGGGGFP